MSDWIFTGKDYKSGTEEYSANHIYRRRMQDGFWGLGEKTRNRTSVQKGIALCSTWRVLYARMSERRFWRPTAYSRVMKSKGSYATTVRFMLCTACG